MAKTPAFKLSPLSLTDVTIDDAFWGLRLETNRRVTIPHGYRMLQEMGAIDALKLTWRPGDEPVPHIFWDSDLAKWLEGACHSLTTHPDAALRKQVDGVVRLLEKAQQPDGYLNSHYTVVEPQNRWGNLRDCHELYCAGHLMEAAVAHFEATGTRTLLEVACRYGDHIDRIFGRGKGKKRGYPGHEEIELALVKLSRATGERRYLRLSKYFVDERGRTPHYYDLEARSRGETPGHGRRHAYWQAHAPVRDQHEAVGHAVRAMYLYCGMTDVAAETGDVDLFAACRRLWDNMTGRKMYVTGGIGARPQGEAFGDDYELPNETAYAETCAAIGLVFWAHRMLHVTADGQYADVMERALYNGFLAGVGLDGKSFFYVNTLAYNGEPGRTHGRCRRQEWFGCACCPTNVVRLLGTLGTYAYSTGPRSLYVHLYLGGTARAAVAGEGVELRQETAYPWDGRIRLTVNVEKPVRFGLRLRIPDWCEQARLRVNGRQAPVRVTRGYAALDRVWRSGDTIALSLAMPVRVLHGHPLVPATAGHLALQRGPLVYCAEQADQRVDLRALRLPRAPRLTAKHHPRLLGGVTCLHGAATAPPTSGALYSRAARSGRRVAFKAVPYAFWANRRPGPMRVWLPTG